MAPGHHQEADEKRPEGGAPRHALLELERRLRELSVSLEILGAFHTGL